MPEISLTRLKELFIHDETKGILIWRKSLSNRALAGSVAGCITPDGYRQIQVDGKAYRAHNLVWLYAYGKLPTPGIDHENHTRDDNRISNLRLADRAANQKNLSMRYNNSSGVVGVSWYTAVGTWHARIGVNGKCVHLGYFPNKKDAIKARRAAEKKYGFHPNHGK